MVFSNMDFENKKIESILESSRINKLNSKYRSLLGRDNDPQLVSDISSNQLLLRKIGWTILTAPGLDFIINFLYPQSTRHHFKVNNAVAFTIDDSAGAYERLSAGGFSPQDPVHLRRPLTLGDGSQAEVAFTVLRVPPEKMPEGRIQMLRQETPGLVWQDHIIARDNGILALGGVILCVDNVDEGCSL